MRSALSHRAAVDCFPVTACPRYGVTQEVLAEASLNENLSKCVDVSAGCGFSPRNMTNDEEEEEEEEVGVVCTHLRVCTSSPPL